MGMVVLSRQCWYKKKKPSHCTRHKRRGKKISREQVQTQPVETRKKNKAPSYILICLDPRNTLATSLVLVPKKKQQENETSSKNWSSKKVKCCGQPFRQATRMGVFLELLAGVRRHLKMESEKSNLIKKLGKRKIHFNFVES